MQNFKVITNPNQNPKVEIEGVGTVRQIEIAEKLFSAGIIDWKCRNKSQRIALTDNIINIAINELNLFPRQF
jgi:hypothetical protein